ncbi:MAG: sodium-dependent bicarbonate transport family permease [Nitrosomonas sp.]|nr:sodium-dependent bicarbonate transport family permease [Nitrosomonas sp.]MBK7363867.1 sodium-dependent bicarbonate transport family permease [Nitrosomonas sp.]
MGPTIQPVVLFFVMGVVAGVIKSDLKIPEALYKSLSIFLLIAIGLKGGVSLSKYDIVEVLPTSLALVVSAALVPLGAYPILRFLGKFNQADSGAIAAHYGSVSAVTFAVGLAFMDGIKEYYEGYMPLFLALLEVPALVTGTILALAGAGGKKTQWGKLMHEVLTGASIYLLMGAICIGYYAGSKNIAPLDKLYMDLFIGALSLFLLEMGLLAAARIGDVIRKGPFMLAFGILFPLTAGLLGAFLGWAFGLSPGGTMVLAVLYASASYIAAPAAMRIAVPAADPAMSIGLSLGVTFPFNIFIGVPIYWEMAKFFHGV